MAVRLLVNAVVTGQRQVDTLQNSVGRLSRQARFLQTALIGAFAAQGAAGLVRSVTEATDTVTQLQNQLTAAGVAAEGIAAAQADVVRLADMTRSSIEATGGLYARVLRSTRELGISQQQGLTISRAFQETLALSGASTQEAASASLQFGQALASGRLQGDELRSILENNSFFAQAFARELGVGVGQLRRMGAEGELTSELLADVALRIAPMVNEQFAALQPTFAQAGQVLRNELLLATNELGQTLRSVLGDVVASGSWIWWTARLRHQALRPGGGSSPDERCWTQCSPNSPGQPHHYHIDPSDPTTGHSTSCTASLIYPTGTQSHRHPGGGHRLHWLCGTDSRRGAYSYLRGYRGEAEYPR